MPMNACRNCENFYMDGEGYEFPQFGYPNCRSQPHLANLTSFPFSKTYCPYFEKKKTQKENTYVIWNLG